MEKVLVVSNNCGSCVSLKRYLSKAGLLEKTKIIDIDSDMGQTLVKKLDLKGVPDCVLVDQERKVIRRCTDQEWANMLEGK